LKGRVPLKATTYMCVVVAMLFGLLEPTAEAQGGGSTAMDGKLLSATPHELPGYPQLPGWAKHVFATPQSYESMRRSSNLELLKIHYLSDGLNVVGFLYKPKATKGIKLPAILWCRGWDEEAAISNANFQDIYEMYRLASAGYVVLAPQYRGVDGGEGRDEVGGKDVDDIMNLAPLAASLGYVDMDRLFIWGISRGGMMALQAIRAGLPVRAAAVVGVPADWKQILEENPALIPFVEEHWPDYAQHPQEAIYQRSPAYWAEEINVPLLIISGGDDIGYSSRQPLLLAEKLTEHEKAFELMIYAGDDHIVSKHQEERLQRTVEWFQNPRQISIATVCARILFKDGISAVVRRYRELRESSRSEYDFGEPELNGLGRRLLGIGHTAEAIEVLKLNAESYPDSTNAYDSLAEAYQASGHGELAARNYEHSLTLDPKDEHARRALAKLKAP
jgi:dienelactone hydrolase